MNTTIIIWRIFSTILVLFLNIILYHVMTYFRFKLSYYFRVHTRKNYFEYYLNLNSKNSSIILDAFIVLLLFFGNYTLYLFINQFVIVAYILGLVPMLLLYSGVFPFSENFTKYLKSFKLRYLYIILLTLYFSDESNKIEFRSELRRKLSPGKLLFLSIIILLLMLQEFILV